MRMVQEDFAFNYEKENMESILTETRKQRFKPPFLKSELNEYMLIEMKPMECGGSILF